MQGLDGLGGNRREMRAMPVNITESCESGMSGVPSRVAWQAFAGMAVIPSFVQFGIVKK